MSTETLEPVTSEVVVPSKEELEREKLILEIKQLKDPWWKKPAYMLAALPTLLAVLSLIYGFANGYFQAAATKLENQKHDLQIERDKIQADINESSKEREDLVRQNKELSDKLASSKEEMKRKYEEYGEKMRRGEEAEPPWK